MYAIISRWFYAQKDTKTPLIVSLLAISLNILLAYSLSRPTAYGISGLAMAQSIVAGIEMAVLMSIMLIRDRRLFDTNFWAAMVKIVSVTGFSMVAALLMVSIFPLQSADRGVITLGSKLFAISAVTMAMHVAVSWLFELKEVQPIISKAKEVTRWTVKI